MYVVRLRIRCNCCCKRSSDQVYTALWRLSRTLTATDGCVAEAKTGSATSPNSSRPAIVSTAEDGAANEPPDAIVKL
jgi:hypothetical protein